MLGGRVVDLMVILCLCGLTSYVVFGLQRQTPSWYNTRHRRLSILYRIDGPKKQCVVDNRYRFRFNTVVTVPRGGKCIVFYCTARFGLRLIAAKSGCPYNGKCIKRNAIIEEDCTKYQCYFWSKKKTDRVSFQNLWYVKKQGCENRGKCLKLRETFIDKDYCGVYRCSKIYKYGKANYTMKHIENRCPYQGKCMKIDKRYQQQHEGACTILKCKFSKSNEGNMTLNVVQNRCQEPNGKCARPGTRKKISECYRGVCTTLPDGRAYYFTKFRRTRACHKKYGIKG